MTEYQPISIDRHGVPTLTLPPAAEVTIRTCASPDDWAVMQWGPIAAYPDLEWLQRIQAESTRCMVELGYGDQCATPESLARTGGGEA